jgi:hypothetical protein
MVGLLATVGAAMTAFGTLLHGLFIWVVIFAGAAATGLVTYLSFASIKKNFGWVTQPILVSQVHPEVSTPTVQLFDRFAARARSPRAWLGDV